MRSDRADGNGGGYLANHGVVALYIWYGSSPQIVSADGGTPSRARFASKLLRCQMFVHVSITALNKVR